MYGFADSVVLATGDAVDTFETLEDNFGLEELVGVLQTLFAPDNPRFDRETFYTACGFNE